MKKAGEINERKHRKNWQTGNMSSQRLRRWSKTVKLHLSDDAEEITLTRYKIQADLSE
jgi:hypothetical protein